MIPASDLDLLVPRAREAAALLKSLSHEARLLIMYLLIDGEKSVTELEKRLGRRQAAVSQQLARLRLDGLVKARRNGKAIYYSIASPRAADLLERLRQAMADLPETQAPE